MNTLSRIKFFKSYKTDIIIFISLMTFFKLLSVGVMYFLPSSSVFYVEPAKGSSFKAYRLSSSFDVEAIKQEVVKEQPKVELPVYQINDLELKATYSNVDGTGFILVKDGQESIIVSYGEFYKDYLLEKVLPKKAVFIKGEKAYELLLKDDSPNVVTKKVVNIQESLKTKEIVDTPQVMNKVNRGEIKKYRENISMIWNNIKLKPYNENGQIAGFEVTYVNTESVFHQLGLQEGDILKEANGLKLSSVKDALNLYKQIDKINTFKIVFERNGQEKELEYEIY